MKRLGAGVDNAAYLVDGLVVRFRRAEPASAELGGVEQEARLLEFVAQVSPFPVPVPEIVDAGRGCLAYRLLPGVPLISLPSPLSFARSVGVQLGELLAALHAVPPGRVAGLVPTDETPPADWLAETTAMWPEVAALVPADFRSTIESFLAAPPPPAPAEPMVFSHQDLGIEHVLVDPETGAITGIIDWTDAAVGDPSRDLGLILRDLGPEALTAALSSVTPPSAAPPRAASLPAAPPRAASLPAAPPAAAPFPATLSPAGLRERALFYARCGLIEDLAYGQEPYVRKSLAALGWVFPPSA